MLVVGDEAAILELARESLQHLGYTVLAASSPEEAMRRSEEQAGPMSGYTADVIAHRGVLDEGVRFIGMPCLRTELRRPSRAQPAFSGPQPAGEASGAVNSSSSIPASANQARVSRTVSSKGRGW